MTYDRFKELWAKAGLNKPVPNPQFVDQMSPHTIDLLVRISDGGPAAMEEWDTITRLADLEKRTLEAASKLMPPSIRCVLLIGTVAGLESMSNPLLGQICHHSVGFSAGCGPEDTREIAAHLRELADMLEAPEVPDPDLI